jgi:hypothetical protein
MLSGLRFLPIEVILSIGSECNNPNPVLMAHYRRRWRIDVKTMSLMKPAHHRGPEAAAHQPIDLR